MPRDSFQTQIWPIFLGAALALGGIILALFRPSLVTAYLVPLPAIYAEALAGSLFWIRAQKAEGREKAFWRLWSCGSCLWIVAGLIRIWLQWQAQSSSALFIGLAFTFLPQVLFMAALVMQPEISAGQLRDPVVRYEAALVALWWIYLYALFLGPSQWIVPRQANDWRAFSDLHDFQNTAIAIWLVALARWARKPWRHVYECLAGSIILLDVSLGFFYRAWDSQNWLSTMFLQALLAASFLWLSQAARLPAGCATGEPAREQRPTLGVGSWLASFTAIGVPALALWAGMWSGAPAPVRHFRLLVFFATLIVAMLVLYRWQDVAENQRERLAEELERTVHELRRLQGQFGEAEKLASLGQLATGAAHEINNPLTAILGYSELLRGDPSVPQSVHDYAKKIGDQTRRMRNLVQNLLRFTQQESREVTVVDVAGSLEDALELRRISSGQREDSLSFVQEPDSPSKVRGDPEKLLQLFYWLLLALSEGEANPGIEIHLGSKDAGGRVIIEFVGRPPLHSPAGAAPVVPPVQRARLGSQLSMNICYAIVAEHGGLIARENLADGARVFRVELPAANGNMGVL